MNGHTRGAPPSVQQARRPQPTGLSRPKILGALLVLVALGFVLANVFIPRAQKASTSAPIENTLEPIWGRQTFQYKAEEPILPTPPKPPVDTVTPELAKLRAELGGMKQEIETLKNRKMTTVIQQGEPKRPAPVRLTPTPMVFVAHDLGKEPQTSARNTIPDYILAPTTFLPCQVETEMNSEVEGYFTAKVNQNVYDSATHRHLLVPQGSTILGHDNSSQLVYGNERMDTLSLKLTFPDGRSVELGSAPVTDQQGVAGLTGDVDQHYLRLFGAVFIGGALKGGMQAMQMGITEAAGVAPSPQESPATAIRPPVVSWDEPWIPVRRSRCMPGNCATCSSRKN